MEIVLKDRVLFQKNKIMLKKEFHGTYFKKEEIVRYLHMLATNPEISKFLKYDCCFRLADNYLLAMVFVYFKRAGLKPADFTFTNFFAALLLAHAMVEEDDSLITEILHWALPGLSDDSDLVSQLETVKFLLFQAMDLRGYVTRSCCKLVMSIAPHSLWSRQRDALHAGAARGESAASFHRLPRATYDWRTSSCKACRAAKFALLQRPHHSSST